MIKGPGQVHFKFNPSKRFIFTKSNDLATVRGEINYRIDHCKEKSILKKYKRFNQFKPNVLPIQNKLKGNKSTIHSLIKKHNGDAILQDY